MKKARDRQPSYPPPLEKPLTPRQKELYQQAINLIEKSLKELVNPDHPDAENAYNEITQEIYRVYYLFLTKVFIAIKV